MVTTQNTTYGPSQAPIAKAIEDALTGRLLLTHPFYQRWEAGTLRPGELDQYARQYRSFEAALPQVLSGVIERLAADGSKDVADLVQRNLDDELGHPEPHLALFDRFATAVSAQDSSAETRTEEGPAAAALVATYADLVNEGPVAALSALAAYETQASAIASSKAEGLRRWYGIDGAGTAFWDVHATMDADHGDWAINALAQLDAGPALVADAAKRAADAWWTFLDEREAAAPAGVSCTG
ncbi:MAG TPA: iron-containing redox enzyme family protein [Acidimicrobiales bacterium]|jgi:pyrroloquinoline-quinone synthase|nr:iron-containing redox enzyme family protein [Acidimicrobiales bacterium]